MAKDDYDVILYRILVYYCACMKRKIIFEEETFNAAVRKNVDSDEYFADILRMMQEEELIEGIAFVRAWCGITIIASDLRDARITAKGMRYIRENSTMKKIGEMLKESADIIASLAAILSLV